MWEFCNKPCVISNKRFYQFNPKTYNLKDHSNLIRFKVKKIKIFNRKKCKSRNDFLNISKEKQQFSFYIKVFLHLIFSTEKPCEKGREKKKKKETNAFELS